MPAERLPMKKIRDVLRLTHALVPDNPKAGVTKPSRHEPGINRSYQDLADHYGCVMAQNRGHYGRQALNTNSGQYDARANVIESTWAKTMLSYITNIVLHGDLACACAHQPS
jgi:hypothetical protein